MNENWLRMAVGGIVSACLVVSVVECAVDGSEEAEGFKLICGLAVSTALIRAAAEMLRSLL